MRKTADESPTSISAPKPPIDGTRQSSARATRFARGTASSLADARLAKRARLCNVDVRPHIRPDPWLRKIVRRLVTVPALFVVTLLWIAAGVVVLPTCIVADVIAQRPLLWTRAYISLTAIIAGQIYAIVVMFAIWLVCGCGFFYQRCNAMSAQFTGHWGCWNFHVLRRVFAMNFVVEGDQCLRDGPTILLSRHASIIDTILPIGLIQQPHGVRLRIVLKHELIYSPPVDTIGHRVPTAFVRRSAVNKEQELDAVRRMTRDMHAQESVLIFPEGTRFSAGKRLHILHKLQGKDSVASQRAAQLTHILPLRAAGINTLMQQLPNADLVFCAHTGFEQANRLEDFFAGGLYRANVHVAYWRVAAADVPRDPAARATFLHQQWLRVNTFVAKYTG
jgi:1-acyl-sn-glycerol-3-phosphate acyltransferase